MDIGSYVGPLISSYVCGTLFAFRGLSSMVKRSCWLPGQAGARVIWVAVKEFDLSYQNPEIMLPTVAKTALSI